MEVKYLGHSCFLVQSGGYNVLFDPFISPNPLASPINVDALEVDYILISHAHENHTADVEYIAKKTGAGIISNYEICTYYRKKGIENVFPMNIGGKQGYDFGTVKLVEAVHSSSFPDGTYGGNPSGFVVEMGDKTFYYSGDTALHYNMRLVGDVHHIDFAFICIGDNFTMDINDAMAAAAFVNTNRVIGMHYDTFPVIEIDHIHADMTARKAGVELSLMKIGETLKF